MAGKRNRVSLQAYTVQHGESSGAEESSEEDDESSKEEDQQEGEEEEEEHEGLQQQQQQQRPASQPKIKISLAKNSDLVCKVLYA